MKRLLALVIALAAVLGVLPMTLSVTRAESALLSGGKSYTVAYDSPIDNAYPKKAYKKETKLTDGKTASKPNYNDAAFTQFYRGTTLFLTFDLEAVCAVASVEVSSLQQKAAGIYCPRVLSAAVSEDGAEFGTVAELKDGKSCTGGNAVTVKHQLEFDRLYRARYVRVAINCDVFLYIDEVSIYGSEDLSTAQAAAPDTLPEDRGFSPAIDGISNIALMYTVGNYQAEHLLPYFAYVDENGEPVDTMYDGMLFLPSGASGYDFSSPKGWDEYLDGLFGESTNTNLTALNRTVKEYGSRIGYPEDKKYPVFLAIHKITAGSDDFDGMYPLNLETTLDIVKMYVDRMIERFNAGGFDRLELKGFYWHEEQIPYHEYSYAEDLASGFTSYVHEKGLKALWIPYYCAVGFERANELGFDGACLQSGYAFDHSGSENGDSLAAVCEDSAAQAKKYGLGIEFELDLNVKNFYKRFFKYVHTAYAAGCMNGGLMAMYQSVYSIYQCARAESNSDERKVYDLLYQYIHDTFTSTPPRLEKGQVVLAKLNDRVNGKLIVEDADSKTNELKLKRSEIQEGLTAVFEGDGFFLINTKDTVPGTYSATLTVWDGYNLADPEEVLVVVYDPAAEQQTVQLDKDIPVYARIGAEAGETCPKGTNVSLLPIRGNAFYLFRDGEPVGIAYAEDLGVRVPDAEQSGGEESIGGPANGGSLTPLWIALGACGAAAVLGVVLAVILKKRKKKT